MARITELHKKWMRQPKHREAYEALEDEFVLASAVMDVRNRAGLTQEQLARKMGTTQPVVARLESGRSRPSIRTLERIADATGSRLLISFTPRQSKKAASTRADKMPGASTRNSTTSIPPSPLKSHLPEPPRPRAR